MRLLSIILPIFNEDESLPHLIPMIREAVGHLAGGFEIIAVDDGSTDKSFDVLERLAREDARLRVVRFRRNFGQTAAFAAGIEQAKGDVIVLMDADLQNDPHDIPRLLEKIEEGYDVASGWRQDRKDPFFSRRLPSRLANWLISYLTGVHLHDYGCSLKAYRREVIKDMRLYGEMHRFIPAYAAISGARIAEIPVTHHARKYGRSKYTIARTRRVVLDLLVAKFIGTYFSRPIHFFGGIGLWFMFGGGVAGAAAVYFKLVVGKSFISTPLPLVTIFLFTVGVQFLLIGFVAEMLARNYYESQEKKPYVIRDTMNL